MASMRLISSNSAIASASPFNAFSNIPAALAYSMNSLVTLFKGNFVILEIALRIFSQDFV
jgi:hypothetical protein